MTVRTLAARRALVATLALLLAACGSGASAPAKPSPAAPAAGQPTAASGNPYTALCPPSSAPHSMVLAIWGGPHESIMKEGLAGFTQLTGIQVELTLDSVRDRLTKLNAEKGNPSIDVAMVSVDSVPRLLASGVVMPAATDVPNVADMAPVARVDGGYGISLLQEGIGYNPQYVTTPPTSWSDLLKPEWAGHLAWPSMPNASSLAVLTMFAKANGGSEANFQPGIDAIARVASGVKTFYAQEPQIEPQYQSGDVWIAPAIAGLVQAMKDKGGPVAVSIPKEGGPILMNVATIPVGVKSLGCSKALVGWLLSEAVQRPYAEQLFYGPANHAVTLPPEVKQRVYPQDEASAVTIDWKTISDKQSDILDQWNRQVVGR
ncbi:MAG TPA: extracellular solute-binding protein [Chloroflexota bacterium]|jgi:putative spermidine/putrescine transport system substrate-binding protein